MIELVPLAVEIGAPRALVYEMVSAIGGGSLPGEPPHRAEVLERRGDELIVHYQLPRRIGTVDLIERVTLHEPERIEFELLHGPLDRVSEEIGLDAIASDRTVVRYRGEAGHRLPIIGPLLVRMAAVPAYERYMRQTFAALKAAAEARAVRSRRHAGPTEERTDAIGQSTS